PCESPLHQPTAFLFCADPALPAVANGLPASPFRAACNCWCMPLTVFRTSSTNSETIRDRGLLENRKRGWTASLGLNRRATMCGNAFDSNVKGSTSATPFICDASAYAVMVLLLAKSGWKEQSAVLKIS